MSSSSDAIGAAGLDARGSPRVLADTIPGGLVRDVLLVAAYALFVGAAAQLSVRLGDNPVPVTGQTFAVLAGAAALGPVRGAIGMLAYMALGMAGVPWFAPAGGDRTGLELLGAPSFGYIVGFVLAAGLVGALARRGLDRTVVGAAGIFVLGNLVIYAVGVPWLMAAADMDLAAGIANGVRPFLVGDALKIALAAGVIRGAWALARPRG